MGARWEAHRLKADDISTQGKGRRARAAKQTKPFGKADCDAGGLYSGVNIGDTFVVSEGNR
jgi:hypothetical protein